jgi:hypothetical protein
MIYIYWLANTHRVSGLAILTHQKTSHTGSWDGMTSIHNTLETSHTGQQRKASSC